jgi:hypothetical protein
VVQMRELLEVRDLAANDEDVLTNLVARDARYSLTQLPVMLVQRQVRRVLFLDLETDQLAEVTIPRRVGFGRTGMQRLEMSIVSDNVRHTSGRNEHPRRRRHERRWHAAAQGYPLVAKGRRVVLRNYFLPSALREGPPSRASKLLPQNTTGRPMEQPASGKKWKPLGGDNP